MIYPYICEETGETRELIRSMKDAPPMEFEEDGKRWVRDLAACGIQVRVEDDHATRYKGHRVPVSYTLPPDSREGTIAKRGDVVVREHADGTASMLDGTRIIDSKRSADIHAKECGFERD